MKPRRGDYFIVLIVLISALLLAFFSRASDEPAVVTVMIDGKTAQSFSLPHIGEYEFSGNGYSCVVELDEMKARVKECDCPDGDCVSVGWLEKCGDRAVCLPARIIVCMEGNGGIDAVVY
ncbi:MAG: NusG domain II-containing protein [Clostridiales bacterium]|nr:NusG domain II-containing protein [Clostridiales bacterium]